MIMRVLLKGEAFTPLALEATELPTLSASAPGAAVGAGAAVTTTGAGCCGPAAASPWIIAGAGVAMAADEQAATNKATIINIVTTTKDFWAFMISSPFAYLSIVGVAKLNGFATPTMFIYRSA